MGELMPNWLVQELEEIQVRFALNYDTGTGFGPDKILSEKQSEELRARMAERFRAWTGRSLLNQEKEGQ